MELSAEDYGRYADCVDECLPFAIEAKGFAFSYPEVAACESAGLVSLARGDGASRASIGPLDWAVSQGSFQLLVGLTGSGKTTLLRSLKPSIAPAGDRSGLLRAFGCSVEDMDAVQSAELVGYVAQDPDNQIVCDTVWHEIAFGLENLGTPQDVMRRRVAEVAHFFGIEPWFRRRVDELSGGQRQIVTLASVLALRPRLLLLDEPTSQLDPVAEKTFLHMLFRINRELGVTVVVATHSPETMVEYATDAVCMRNGVLESVDLDEFRAEPLRLEACERESQSEAKVAVAEASNVFARYSRQGDWVLRGFDLSVDKGCIHAIVGGNGCGKSTALKMLAGVLKPEHGRMRNDLKRCQALLLQDPKALFVCDSVLEELQEWQKPCGYSDDDIAQALNRFGLSKRAAHHPCDLSGGQQQLLALAKLMLTKPQLLLLDEPTKGLDSSAKLMVAGLLRDAADQGVTVLVATHDLSFAALVSGCVTMLFDGENAATQDSWDFFKGNLFYRPAMDGFARKWLAGDRGVAK